VKKRVKNPSLLAHFSLNQKLFHEVDLDKNSRGTNLKKILESIMIISKRIFNHLSIALKINTISSQDLSLLL
jgi:hypothetical protein